MNAFAPPSSPPVSAAPQVIARPALWLWLQARGIDFREAGAAFRVSHATVWAWCLPFADPRRVEPKPAQAEAVWTYTAGEIPPESFRPPCAGSAT